MPLADTKFLLGDWLIDPVGSIIDNGSAIKLDHKVMQLLCYLAEHQGEILTRDQILTDVWDRQYVADDVLNVAISSLRKALGDNPKNPIFIKTVPRKGYQLLVEVKVADENTILTEKKSIQLFNRNSVVSINKQHYFIYGAIALFVCFIFLLAQYSQNFGNNSQNSAIRIAVLPFSYLSSDDKQSYIADGLTDAIINSLVQLDKLKVISRTTIMTLKDSDKTLKELGDMLNVDWVLEGAVQINGEQLSVTSQLIEVSRDQHAWSQKYQRGIDDLFAIQTDIANQVSSSFNTSPIIIDTQANINPKAYHFFLRGEYYRGRFDLDKADEFYQKALKKQNDYAEAYAGLAQNEFLRAFGGKDKTLKFLESASHYSIKAYELAPNSANVQLNYALYQYYKERNYQAADKAFEKAFQLNNQHMMIQEWYMSFLLATQQFSKAETLIQHMRKVSPLLYNKTSLFQTLYYAHDFDSALEAIDALTPYTDYRKWVSSSSAWVYMAKGDTQKLIALAPGFLDSLEIEDKSLVIPFSEILRLEGIAPALTFLLEEHGDTLDDYERAELYAWSGAGDKAIDILEKLVARYDLHIYKFHIEPSFISLHDHERFQKLAAKLAVPRL